MINSGSTLTRAGNLTHFANEATPLPAVDAQGTPAQSTLRRLQTQLAEMARALINLNRRYREQQDQLNEASAHIEQLEAFNQHLQENNALLRWHNQDLMQQCMLLKGLVPHPDEGGDSNFADPMEQQRPASAARSQQSQPPRG